MAIRVDAWKMHIGVKKEGIWWNEKYYPSVPYLFNLLMDPMEKMDPESHEWGYVGRKFFAAEVVGADGRRALSSGAPAEPCRISRRPGRRHARA